MKLEKELLKIQKNISLAKYTTFKIDSRVKYFFIAKTKNELIKAIKVAKNLNLPFFILGGGSNLLVSDKGYKGLIIKTQNSPKESLRLPTGQAKLKNIYVEAGTLLAKVVLEATKNNLTGLEWTAGIPGTVGGAIRGNAGAFRRSMKDIVKEVEVYDIKNEKIIILKNKNCKFGYRDSIFKHKKNFIILSVIFRLKKGNSKRIKMKIKEFLNYRKETQPLNFPSAGSVFKNPAGFSAGELIEKCGLKGKRIGNVKISEKHANFIVNLGGGKAKNVKKLINLAKKRVKNKFGVVLEEEIQIL